MPSQPNGRRASGMLDAEVIDRLRELNRRAPITAARDRHVVAALKAEPSLSGIEEENAWGAYWRIDSPVDVPIPGFAKGDPPADARSADTRSADTRPGNRLRQCAKPRTDGGANGGAPRIDDELGELSRRWTRDALYLDLETCGFAGSAIFLVGLVRTVDGIPRLTQLLARTYAEEKAVLQTLWNIVSACGLLVTFNGKSFDWPCVQDRSTLHHLGRDPRFPGRPSRAPSGEPLDGREPFDRNDPRPNPRHVDLLHVSRRHWKGAMPNFRLQTLEQRLCGRFRIADIPSSDIPDAYAAFVHTQDPGPMRSILHHNALDLITMVQITARLIERP